jgi:hypothetical protein
VRPWYIGNTTVRSPFRLRDGLIELSNSPLQGNLRGKEQELAFCELLGSRGIVELGNDVTYSVGRKWRSALNKMGFLYPQVPQKSSVSQDEIGNIDTITPSGWRLIRANNVPAMQECFLRALVAHFIPSPLEQKYAFAMFSPLRHTLAVMLALEQQTGESRLDFIEMALVIQFTSSSEALESIVERVLGLRNRRLAAVNKRQFDRHEHETAAALHGYVTNTFDDYADMNIRYLKSTGLVQGKGHGLSLVPEKHVFVEKLVQDTNIPDSDRSYFLTLCKGAALPTDNRDSAQTVLHDLLLRLKSRNIAFEMSDRSTQTPEDIAIIRYEIEGILSKEKEREYAALQNDQWEEIAAYMGLIINRKTNAKLNNDIEITIPKGEAPAYFEWILWRAFLAIDSLRNQPHEARRFNLDQDLLPVSTAPGNGPDLVFEFDEFVLVVEVTLTDNSRQEAAEGEPVRRHVADLVSKYTKPIYGLFIANRIDSNTAETFRIGIWFTREDKKIQLNIIPMTLAQFQTFFRTLFESQHIDVGLIHRLMELCGELRAKYEAPGWKSEIEAIINLQKYLPPTNNI